MGLFSWGKKSAKKIANATLEAAKLEAQGATDNAAAIRAAAEQQAAATAESSRLASEAAARQEIQIGENAARSEAAALRQEELIKANGAAQLDAAGRQERLIGEQGAAAKASAEAAALDARKGIKAQQMQREGDAARQQAVEKAAELLDTPKNAAVDVTLASGENTDLTAEVDPQTGRKRPARASFMSERATGITI